MRSFFTDLNTRRALNDWRLLRSSGEELRALEFALSQARDSVQLTPKGFSGTRLVLCPHEGLVIAIEPEPMCPGLISVQGEKFTVGWATLSETTNTLASFEIDTDFSVVKPEHGSVHSVMENLWRLWEQRCRSRALESVQNEHRFDREGADFFDAIDGRLRALFAPDYLEIFPLQSGTYWPDRPEGWSWITATRPEFQWPMPLTPEFESSLLSRGTPEIVESLDERVLSLSSAAQSAGLMRGVFFPLAQRGQRMGVVKLLFARDILVSVSEEAILPVVQQGMSLIFERTAQHLKTQRMAMVDGLTNLFNHRFFLTQLRTEFQRSLRYGSVMTLLMIDVDGFKNYNDTYGHQAGNRVLTWVANQIRKTVRDIDVVARYGGEEFALILPEVRAEQGLIVAEKIRKVVSATDIVSDSGDRLAPITISCGVTDSSGCKSPEDMIDRADQALYWVKRNGRNLVRLATLE